uniref:Neuropilin and tolloid-like protein 2 n=1 Tax=Schistosoma haematobium TaxID=6185 RepID=A0A094ZRS2_SCHHA
MSFNNNISINLYHNNNHNIKNQYINDHHHDPYNISNNQIIHKIERRSHSKQSEQQQQPYQQQQQHQQPITNYYEPEEILSPDYTLPYQDIKCMEFIQSTEIKYIKDSSSMLNGFFAPTDQHRIVLHFRGTFELEPESHCTTDFLEIRDGAFGFTTLLGRFCSKQVPDLGTGLISTGQYMWLRFHSDSTIAHRGFQAVYRFIQTVFRIAIDQSLIGICASYADCFNIALCHQYYKQRWIVGNSGMRFVLFGTRQLDAHASYS